jgi:hypothetical protein
VNAGPLIPCEGFGGTLSGQRATFEPSHHIFAQIEAVSIPEMQIEAISIQKTYQNKPTKGQLR